MPKNTNNNNLCFLIHIYSTELIKLVIDKKLTLKNPAHLKLKERQKIKMET
jgi:hypothetical protein